MAQRLIIKARALYVDEDFGVELANTVYALDATTIDLCLSMFPWAPFRSTKAAVKLHTLLDLRGSIPTFIHISDGKMHDVNVLDLLLIEAGAFYIMDRGYLDFERLYALDPHARPLHPACRFRSRPVSGEDTGGTPRLGVGKPTLAHDFAKSRSYTPAELSTPDIYSCISSRLEGHWTLQRIGKVAFFGAAR